MRTKLSFILVAGICIALITGLVSIPEPAQARCWCCLEGQVDRTSARECRELGGECHTSRRMAKRACSAGEISDGEAGPANDLRVTSIHANGCYCDSLVKVDAIFMRNIEVQIENQECGGRGSRASGTVKIEYYDLNEGRMVEKRKSYNLSSGQSDNIRMVDGYVLVKGSEGIEATVAYTGDCNTRNNYKVVHECMSPPVN